MEIENQDQNNNQVENQQEDHKVNAHQKKGRIIIRNLVFDIHEKHLRQLFQKYGEVNDISIPVNPSNGRSKGFAFVQFDNKNNALKSIKELNGSKYKGRTIVLDLAQAKESFSSGKQGQKDKSEQNKEKKGLIDDKESEISIQEAEDKQEELEDFSDSESDIEGNKNQQQVEDSDSESEQEEEQQQQEQEKEEEQVQVSKKKQKKQQKPAEDLSCTVFVRNISFQTEQNEFEEFFKKFGDIHFAKLVINKVTGDNKGTGFVKFKDGEIAQKLIQSSTDFENNTQTLDEPIDLELDSRRLICLKSIDRESAEQKSAIHEKELKNKIDINKVKNLDELVKIDRYNKRNMRLAKLGTFDIGIAKTDQEKDRREKHLKEKIDKLKNPNNVVSQTRVAFKHLPKKNFDEGNLKQMVFSYLNTEKQEIKNDKKIKTIQQVLLLRDHERGDQSRGIAFVEFTQADYAEKFVKECSADIGRFKKDCLGFLPIVEFAIEDIRKIKKFQSIRDQRKQQQKDEKEYEESQNKESGNQKNKKEQQKSQMSQQLASKLQIHQHLENKQSSSKEQYLECMELLNGVKSRGAKQRLHKRITDKYSQFVGSEQQQNAEEQQKQEKKVEVKGMKTVSKMQKDKVKTKVEQRKQQSSEQKKQLESKKEEKLASKKSEKEKLLEKKKQLLQKKRAQEEKKAMKTIQQGIKNKRKAKKQADETDDLDHTIRAYLNSQQKKLKWDQ